VMSGECWPNKPVVIAPQFVIARYRLDFLVALRAKDYRRLVAIECDGRDYHSLVEDVERDKHRDEYLKSFGIRTLRYTGSWIYKMGHKSADEVPGILLG
jgi:very-short-patch-repair endonuclease